MTATRGGLDRTFEALIIDERYLRSSKGAAGNAEVCSRLDALIEAGADVVIVGDDQERASIFEDLWVRGVGPELVLVVPRDLDQPELTPTLTNVLDAQLERRSHRRVPAIDEDAEWTLVRDGSTMLERTNETLLTLADGFLGTRGSLEGIRSGSSPSVLAAGVYTGREAPTLLNGPQWLGLDLGLDRGPDVRRVLDMRTGVVVSEQLTPEGMVRTFRFSSLVHPGCTMLRAEGPRQALSGGDALRPPPEQPDVTVRVESDGELARMTVNGSDGSAISAVSMQRTTEPESPEAFRTIERMTAYGADPSRATSVESATDSLAQASAIGFDRLLNEHRAAWGSRWADADISIDGDPEVQFGARFAIFHLLSSVASHGEAAVGARGLTGSGYAGHVFWDADVFVLPALVAMNPPAARAMLEYRIRRLESARGIAVAHGRDGARFPWESAQDGNEVTPREYRNQDGDVVPIRTGELEEHIVADVAWAAWHYAEWSGDDAFLRGPGASLLTETARYWASRVRRGEDGRAHIDDVIGPDEYHESVDDNAFTNVMARWNLRAAAELIERQGSDVTSVEQAKRWRELADALVDGFDPLTRRYEQFVGFSHLEPLLIAELANPPVAADLLLGAARVKGSQVIKQADVLMLHHLVPDHVAPGSLEANLDYYLPRTAHGSSLSPAIHASLLARAGRPDEARELLALACRLDLDDLTGITAGGLHVATMGGVWQALVFGFAGVRTRGGVLALDPCLPAAWAQLRLSLLYRGCRLQLHVSADEIEVVTDRPLQLRVGVEATHAETTHAVTPPGTVFVRRANRWTRRQS